MLKAFEEEVRLMEQRMRDLEVFISEGTLTRRLINPS